MFKLIACDLDQTLLGDDRKVSIRNIEAINKAKEYGVKFVIATGRGYQSVQDVLVEIESYDQSDEYVISLNGAIITENKDNRVLSFMPLAKDAVAELCTYAIKNNMSIHTYTIDHMYVFNLMTKDKEYLHQRIEYTVVNEKELLLLADQEIAKVIFYYDNKALRDRTIDEIRPITFNKLAVSYSAGHYIEINHIDVDKGSGLIALSKILNIDLVDTIAIGDNLNDLSMVKLAGVGVSVKNGHDGLKAIADIVCEADNNSDAISEVIHKYIL